MKLSDFTFESYDGDEGPMLKATWSSPDPEAPADAVIEFLSANDDAVDCIARAYREGYEAGRTNTMRLVVDLISTKASIRA